MQKSVPAFLAVIALALVVGALSLFSRSALSQRPAPATALAGRYLLTLGSNNMQYILDTQTGRLWLRSVTSYRAPWQEQSPDYNQPMVVAKPYDAWSLA